MVASEYNSPQTIIDNMHSAIIVIGQDLQIFCMNPAAEMLFHISNSRAVKKNIRQLVHEEHDFFNRLEKSLISAHPYTVYEDKLGLHHHETIDVDYSVSPLQYKSEGNFLLLEFFRLKASPSNTNEDSVLHQYEASKSLLRGLAHEIKNPLGGIRGAAQLLEREMGETKNDDNKQLTQIIINETDRLKNLLDRMVGPKDIPTKSEVNIHKILEHVRHLVQAENEQITFTADYDPSIPELYADEAMMIQVILNITRNAVIAIDTERTQGEVNFKTRTQRNCKIGTITYPLVARIDIRDNGSGVAPEIQKKIFMPMITGRADGTGLGLSIAQSLAHQHNGLIEFISEPGETIFTTLLPINIHNKQNTGVS
ncbi:MAG: PAS domain-containing protein [Gammaproteobacteria bacterium]|nr:PAS domain-containing protein [Gammaproteobacteria bacterium]